MGVTAFRQIGIATETAAGTALPATAALLGKFTMKDSATWHRPDEDRGTLIKPYRAVKVAELTESVFDGDCTFEQLPYFLSMGVKGGITPTTTTYSGDKTWAFPAALLTVATLDSFTLEYGDDVGVYNSAYTQARRIAISGAMNETMKTRVEMFGRKMTATTFSTGETVPTVESVISQKSALFIAAETGTIGLTTKSATLISWSYDIDTGVYPKRYGDGTVDYSSHGQRGGKAELRCTAIFNADVNTEMGYFRAGTQRLVRIEATGNVIDTAGAYKKLKLDVGGRYTDFSVLEEREGEDVVTFTIASEDSPTYGKGFEVTVVSTSTTLT